MAQSMKIVKYSDCGRDMSRPLMIVKRLGGQKWVGVNIGEAVPPLTSRYRDMWWCSMSDEGDEVHREQSSSVFLRHVRFSWRNAVSCKEWRILFCNEMLLHDANLGPGGGIEADGPLTGSLPTPLPSLAPTAPCSRVYC